MRAALFFLALHCAASLAGAPKSAGFFSTDAKPAFVHVHEDSLFYTSFSGSPFTAGSLWRVDNLSSTLRAGVSGARSSRVDPGSSTRLRWPNEMASSRVAGLPGLFLGDGFLVPGKSTGSVVYVNSSGAMSKVTRDKSGWFYHKVLFFDMDGDGDLDLVTARAHKPLLGAGKGELLWLENPEPASRAASFPWTEHVLGAGPDITISLRNSTLFAAEFFGEALSSFELPHGPRVLLDDSLGAVYDVEPFGPDDLYVTNYSPTNGTLYLYSGPGLVRSVVHAGFRNVQHSPGAGAPGFVYPYCADGGEECTTPNLSVSGDGSEQLYFFQDGEMLTLPFNATVGGQWIGVINAQLHIFVCDYESSKIHVYTL